MPPAVAASADSMEVRVAAGQLVEAAEQADLDALGPQLVRLAPDRLLQELEEPHDLVVGPRPVLATEGVEGHDRDAAPNGVAQELADRLDAGGVAVDLGDAPSPGPAAVAVHDDRDVPGQVGWLRRRIHRGSGLGGSGSAGGHRGLVGPRRSVGRTDQRRTRH